MSQHSSIKSQYQKKVCDLSGTAFATLMQSTDVFICAAGFEARAERVPLAAVVTKNPIIIAFKNGPSKNDETFAKFKARFENVQGFDVCELDLTHMEEWESVFENSIRKLRNFGAGRIVLDISGLPNFAICIAIMKIRQVFPMANLTLLHTEAEEYFPQESDFKSIKKSMAARLSAKVAPEYLSAKAVNMFMPSMFSGVALGHNDACLIVFAGYEPHRTSCVLEATNPSKLVMVYGEPQRPDLKWRLELSRIMHQGFNSLMLMKTEEVSSTGEIDDNLNLLRKYYEYLYDDHVLCVCPTNSKMQAVASALAWEIYPDIQLNFPVPAEYLQRSFSIDWRDTFIIDLGISPKAKRYFVPKFEA